MGVLVFFSVLDLSKCFIAAKRRNGATASPTMVFVVLALDARTHGHFSRSFPVDARVKPEQVNEEGRSPYRRSVKLTS